MLNLGAGNKRLSGYVNIDSREECNPDLVCDIRKLPYDDNSVDKILALDILEHAGRLETDDVLKEWFRILKPKGLLIIKTPNIDTIIDAYKDGKIPFDELIRKLYANQQYIEDTHRSGFNPDNIKQLLISAGFKIINLQPRLGYGDWSNMAIRCKK
ncbi:unnamed protein product [marine sediment metagenome]|uniref:Methyltransferase type 11 domain-containing protein n=1 Tax=marine sediment metagenome TaxID=412755 RepID=X1HCV4_9ZZZZ